MARTVGILGGMGPAATVDFLDRLVTATPARSDAEHLRILLDMNPQVPDRNSALAGTGPSPGPVLAAMAARLAADGAELLAMPCNSAHAWTDAIRAAVAVPFVSMIETAAAAVQGRRVGLLAADACLAAGLYQARLPDALVLPPDAQAGFMALLYRIKAGDTGADVQAEMAAFGERLAAAGAETVLAACTEVPLVLADGDLSVPLVDATDLLVRATIAAATDAQTPRSAR